MAAIQAQIAQQIKSLGQVPTLATALPTIPGMFPGFAPIPGMPTVKKETFKPAPLILDDKGRHVDAEGKEISMKVSDVSILKANQRESRQIPMLQPALVRPPLPL